MPSSESDPTPSRICIFMRHGESQANVTFTYSTDHDKHPLTPYGTEMVENAAKELSKLKKIDKLYTSPIMRARQTAEIVSKHIKIKPEIAPLLLERGFGKYNNMKFNSREEMVKVHKEELENGYTEWESWDSMAGRAGKFAEVLREGNIAIAVSHMDLIKAALGYVLEKSEREMSGVYLEKASFTIIDFNKKGEEAVLAIDSTNIPNGIA